tara:strand:+ start:444 stop:650 length:207 start_codon:yes stop_codon:yes gene_type:complete
MVSYSRHEEIQTPDAELATKTGGFLEGLIAPVSETMKQGQHECSLARYYLPSEIYCAAGGCRDVGRVR